MSYPMEYPFAERAIIMICEHFTDDEFPSELNMLDDEWDEVHQAVFNTNEEYFEYKDYMEYYEDILLEIHNKAENFGIEPQYWNFQKMMNLYFYIIGKELIAECKEEIVEKWRELNMDSESEDETQ
jgi:hypothetical protein